MAMGGVSGYPAMGETLQPRQPVVHEMMARLGGLAEMANTLANRTDMLADLIVGGPKEAQSTKSVPVAVPNGVLDVIDQIYATLNRVESNLSRIDG